MRKLLVIVMCLVVVGALIQTTSAFSVRQVTVPKTDLKAYDPVKIELEMSFVGLSASHDIQFASDLKNTTCVVQTYNEEIQQYSDIQIDRDRVGNWILYGWVLPSDTSIILKVDFEGTVPAVSSSQNITLLHITEQAGGTTVLGGEYIIERKIINPLEIADQITRVRADSQYLKQNITAIAATGADTSAALAKFNDAQNALNKADSAKSSNITQAQNQLDTASTAITDGYSLLEKAGAQYEIKNVEQTLSQVESKIEYFTVNRSISKTDSRVLAITNKYDLASQSISSANDMIKSGNYIGAKGKAIEAGRYADEAQNLSLAFQKEIGEGGFGLSGINPL
ncbi:MAG: hypothetical protein LUO82_07100, partial [Methanomicrobiales archaeon]|nr:hypothetical protein [Methanomicrobiales archaeon]